MGGRVALLFKISKKFALVYAVQNVAQTPLFQEKSALCMLNLRTARKRHLIF